MALTPLPASMSGVFRGNGEGAALGAVFSNKGPFSAFKRRKLNPSTGNGLRLETKGPAHDRTGLLVPPTLWEWNRSLEVWNSVWAWLEGVENVRPSLEFALIGADSGAESRGESGRGGLPQLIGTGGEHLDDTGP